jgi:hypothetical protein
MQNSAQEFYSDKGHDRAIKQMMNGSAAEQLETVRKHNFHFHWLNFVYYKN